MVDHTPVESSSDMTTPDMNKPFLEIDDLLAAIRTQDLLTYCTCRAYLNPVALSEDCR
jgi:hypothetical protein